MRILWAENPLETRVELDSADRDLLRERLRVEHLQNLLFSTYFVLKPREEAQITAEDRVEGALLALDLDYIFDDVSRDGKSFSERLDEQVTYYTQALIEKHDGDCVCFPCSCMKCYAETLLGIDTNKGLGKHPATKINAAFNEGRTIDEAVEWLSRYQPTYTHNPNWPEQEWQKHVSRWIEEGKRAHTWLVVYRDEHFAGDKQ